VLTFDDGLAEHAELVTPLLQERGLRAFFFVCSAPHRARALLPVHRAHVLSGMFGYGALRAEIEAEADRLDAPPLSEGLEDRARAQYRYDDLDTARTKYYLNFVLTPAQRGEILKLVFEARLGAEEAYVRQHYATPTQVRGMVAAGMTIGMHGDHHVALATLAEEDVREDLRVNRDLIEEWTGERPRWVSYPYGGPDSFSPRVTAVAREIGAVGGFTMIRSINTSLARPLRIGRVDTNDAPGGKRPIPLEDLPCASQ
jgi:peptidoglycan/xylan/chitin deacetylase (PgdA/CDA1 family)